MKISPGGRGFLLAWLIFYVPGLLLSLVAALAKVSPPESPGFALDVLPLALLAIIVFPALETIFLIACTTVAMRVLGVGWIAALAGAAPLSLLHFGEGGLVKVGIVLWAFLWSAYCYLRMTVDARPFRTKYVFLFGLHAVGNALAVLAAKLT